MNWREELSTALKKRRIDNNVDFQNTNEVYELIIYPTLIDISNELLIWYCIQSKLKLDVLNLIYGNSGFWFSFKVTIEEDSKVHIIGCMIDLDDLMLEPGVQPTLYKSFTKEVELSDINYQLIVDSFLEAFKPMAKLYRLI